VESDVSRLSWSHLLWRMVCPTLALDQLVGTPGGFFAAMWGQDIVSLGTGIAVDGTARKTRLLSE
jgi:hypothetical protein